VRFQFPCSFSFQIKINNFFLLLLVITVIYLGSCQTVLMGQRHLLSILKKEIKKIFNIKKVTFYIFKVLTTYISRQNFYFNMLNYCPGHCLAFFIYLLYFIINTSSN
jgi:hypothetical protein